MASKTLVVAGAGVVGLAVARAAACRGLEEISARNSEVVHGVATIPTSGDSWKAKLCVKGREQLYDFCEEFSVPFSKCGKLIVVHSHQSHSCGQSSSAGWKMSEARAIEPLVDCDEAVLSPSTGIVDSHGLMMALQGDAETHGAIMARATASKTFVIRAVQGDKEEQEVECDYFVNATGMFAPDLLDKVVAPGVERPPERPRPTVPDRFAKGTYFKLSPKNRPFTHLVYPIPEVGGLGVHATVDLAGNIRFGPDVQWIDEIEYQPDQSKAEKFAERIRAYWPQARAEMLKADYCGIRPKIAINGKVVEDFYIAVSLVIVINSGMPQTNAYMIMQCQDKHSHGVPGLVHLCGIESPGLTASLAIADTVVDMLQDKE
ncbi:FAD/NAD(P)-binding domain [Phytophthora cactorum]|nr:FAD/NAD(P)-binding domain [Phytophthora cactorum]